ncbi:hypothetical protein N9937_01200 [bacterium]|nr:hypothetical protein [bacterium]
MNKTFDQREVQDMQNEMLAAQGEATYLEGMYCHCKDLIDEFTDEQNLDIALTAASNLSQGSRIVLEANLRLFIEATRTTDSKPF